MIDLQVEKIFVRNWMKFAQVKVHFPKYGVVLVTGANTASGGNLQSVGSGKTGFGEALCRTLFGVTGRMTTVKEYSTDEKGNTYVRVEAVYIGKPLVVELGYKCKEMSPNGEALRFTYDGKTIERGLIQQTRDELCKLLGVTPALAEWTVFVDGDNLKFNRLSQSDSVELVMAALKQPPWSLFHERARKQVTELKRVLAADEAEHRQAQERAANGQADVDEAKTDLDEARKQYEDQKAQAAVHIRGFQAQIVEKTEATRVALGKRDEVTRQVKAAENEKAQAHHQLEIQLGTYQSQQIEFEAQREPLRQKWSDAQAESREKKSAYDLLTKVPEKCPTCGKTWDEKVEPKKLQAAKKAAEEAAGHTQAAEQSYRANEARVAENRKHQADLRRQIDELGVRFDMTRWSTQHETLTALLQRYDREILDLEKRVQQLNEGISDADVKAAQAVLAERERVLAADKANLKTKAESLALSRSALMVLEYWARGLSPAGIPNMVLRDSIGPLNHEARRISAAMTGNTIDVRYSTRRALASGEDKPELVVEVDNKLGSKKLKANSKGESGLTNFIIAETLSAVGQVSKRIGLRWYDEIVPHQDPVVCKRLYSYLRDTAQRLGILIFLVDHNPVAANYADYILLVEKQGTEQHCSASIRWV